MNKNLIKDMCCGQEMDLYLDDSGDDLVLDSWCGKCFYGKKRHFREINPQDYWHCPSCKFDDYSYGSDYKIEKGKVIESQKCPFCGNRWETEFRETLSE